MSRPLFSSLFPSQSSHFCPDYISHGENRFKEDKTRQSQNPSGLIFAAHAGQAYGGQGVGGRRAGAALGLKLTPND